MSQNPLYQLSPELNPNQVTSQQSEQPTGFVQQPELVQPSEQLTPTSNVGFVQQANQNVGFVQQPVQPNTGFEQTLNSNQQVNQAFTPESFNNPQSMDTSTVAQQPVIVPPINQQLAANATTLTPPKQEPPKQEQPKQEQVAAPTVITAPPILEEGQEIIAQLSPGAFDSFIKVLSLLDEKGIISIEKSNIEQLINNNSAILRTNIQQLVGNKEIDLHILQPKTNIKLFKAIKDNNDVFIIDDVNNKRFEIVSGDVRVWLPKKIEDIPNEIVAPVFSIEQFIGNPISITKEERTKITTLMSGSSTITLLIKDNQLKGYLIPEKVEATFKIFSGEKVTESNAQLKLVSSAFLSIPSDGDTIITLAKQNDYYWLISKINTAMVEITIMESLQIAQTDQLLL